MHRTTPWSALAPHPLDDLAPINATRSASRPGGSAFGALKPLDHDAKAAEQATQSHGVSARIVGLAFSVGERSFRHTWTAVWQVTTRRALLV
jgi:hypothetical protein